MGDIYMKEEGLPGKSVIKWIDNKYLQESKFENEKEWFVVI